MEDYGIEDTRDFTRLMGKDDNIDYSVTLAKRAARIRINAIHICGFGSTNIPGPKSKNLPDE